MADTRPGSRRLGPRRGPIFANAAVCVKRGKGRPRASRASPQISTAAAHEKQKVRFAYGLMEKHSGATTARRARARASGDLRRRWSGARQRRYPQGSGHAGAGRASCTHGLIRPRRNSITQRETR